MALRDPNRLKQQADLITKTPGVAGNGMARGMRTSTPPSLASGGDARAENFLKSSQKTNSVGAPSLFPDKPAAPVDPIVTPPNSGDSPLDRRGPNFGVPPGQEQSSLQGAPVQVAQNDVPAEAGGLLPDPDAAAKEAAFRQRNGMAPAGAVVPAAQTTPPPAEKPGFLERFRRARDVRPEQGSLGSDAVLGAGAVGSTVAAGGLRGAATRAGELAAKGVNAGKAFGRTVTDAAKAGAGEFSKTIAPRGVNPNVGAAGSAEARAFRAAAPGQFGTTATKAGRFAGAKVAARGLGKLAARSAPAIAGLAAAGAGREAIRQTDDVSKGLRAATPENRPQRMLELGKGALRALNFDFGAAEPEAAPAPRNAKVVPPQEQAQAQPGARAPEDVLRTGAQSGEGALQRTTPGSVGPATSVGNDGSLVSNNFNSVQGSASGIDRAAPQGGGAGGFRGAPILPGAFGSMAALGAHGAATRLKGNQGKLDAVKDRTAAGRERTAAIDSRAQQQLSLQASAQRAATRKAAGADFTKQLSSKANAMVGKEVTGPEREAQVAQIEGDMNNSFQYSLQDSGKEMGDLSAPQKAQLQDAYEFRQAIRDSGAGETFFGQNFDDAQLYNFLPSNFDKDAGTVEVAGKVVDVEDVMGGEFKVFGPNKKIKSHLKRHIDKLKKGK